MRRILLMALAGLFAGAGFVHAQAEPQPLATPANRHGYHDYPAPHFVPWGHPHLYQNPLPYAHGYPYPPTHGPCCPPPKEPCHDRSCCVWVGVEALYWWVKKQPNSFPLASTGSVNGVFDDPDFEPLLGHERFDTGPLVGGRATVGICLGEKCSFEATGFWLPEQEDHQSVRSDGTGNPLLTRPFFDSNFNLPDGRIFAFPALREGSIFANASTELWGGEINLLTTLCRGDCCSLVLIGGARYLQLEEALVIGGFGRVIDTGGAFSFNGGLLAGAGDTLAVTDFFHTRNEIYGGTVGLRAAKSYGRWTFGAQAKLTLGVNRMTALIRGETTGQELGSDPITVDGGLLAVASNSGRFTEEKFVVMPELNVRVQYDLSKCCYVYVGYDLLYINKVIRPGNLLNSVVNGQQVPASVEFDPTLGGSEPPPPNFSRTSDFWGQGANFGIGFRF